MEILLLNNNKQLNKIIEIPILQLQPVIAIVLEPLTMIVTYTLVNANVTIRRLVEDVTNVNRATGVFLIVKNVRFLYFG